MNILLGISLLCVSPFLRETEQSKIIAEKYGYQNEVQLPDGTRVDLITPTHAVEVEWADKWKEAPGQAIYYSVWTNKKPGIILLIKDKTQDKLNIIRCKIVCEAVGIDLVILNASMGT